jgi:hypothetical protein
MIAPFLKPMIIFEFKIKIKKRGFEAAIDLSR